MRSLAIAGALATLLLLPAVLSASPRSKQGGAQLIAGRHLNYPSYPGGPGGPDSPDDSPDSPSWPSWPGGPASAPASAGGSVAGRAWAWVSQVAAAVKQHVHNLPGKVHKRSSDDDDDDDDAPRQLPFPSGTTVALSDPTLSNDDGYDCDVTPTSPWPGPSGSAGGGGFLERVRQALGGLVGGGGKGGDADDSPFVQCDHDASADSSSFWKRTGFMVLADYAQWAPIKEGDAVDLRSSGTFKFCAVHKADGHAVRCDERNKGPATQFALHLVPPEDALRVWRGAARRAGKHADAPAADQLPVYLKHLDSGAYCAAATARPHSPLLCKYALEDKPVLWLKVSNPYPGGPPTPSSGPGKRP